MLYKYAIVIASAGIKFIFGPTLSLGLGLSYWEAVFCTCAGMMLYVAVLSFAGQRLKAYYQAKVSKKKPLFTRRNRWKVRFWRRYGLVGTAFVTPLILTPIGGTMLALSFNEKPAKIMLYMFFSAFFWSLTICFGVFLLRT